jgi:cytochrome b
MSETTAAPKGAGPTGTVRVWDGVVRGGHWLLVAGFATAFISGDEALGLHVAAGYIVAAIVAARVAWGFIGPGHANFASFVRGPRAALAYLRDTARHRGRRYIGHNPAAGLMVVALLLSLAGTCWTGMLVQGETRHAGLLANRFGTGAASGAPAVAPADAAVAAHAPGGDADERAGGGSDEVGGEGGTYGALHEFLADLTLLLIVLHLGGVAFSSLSHRENLVRAMVTGVKRADPA